jgi:hypothetical protein
MLSNSLAVIDSESHKGANGVDMEDAELVDSLEDSEKDISGIDDVEEDRGEKS